MMLFLDTEFTSFHRPQLLSLGLVDDSGDHLFYGRVADFDRDACSDFVIETVIPRLDIRLPESEQAAGGIFPASTLGGVLARWLAHVQAAQGGGRMLVAFDYPTDGDLLLEVLGADRPEWLDVEDIGPKLPVELTPIEHALRHHALFDALELRRVYQLAEAEGWL